MKKGLKKIALLGLFLMLILSQNSLFAVEYDMEISTFYPSATIDAIKFYTETLLVSNIEDDPGFVPRFIIRPFGKLYVDSNAINGLNNPIFMIDTLGAGFEKGLTMTRNSYIDNLISYKCKPGVIPLLPDCQGYISEFDRGRLKDMGSDRGSVYLKGIGMYSMPQVVDAGIFSTYNVFTHDFYNIASVLLESSEYFKDLCYLGYYDEVSAAIPGDPAVAFTTLRGCLDGVDSASKDIFENILTYESGGYRYLNKKGITAITKVGGVVFGVGIGFPISGHFGGGVAVFPAGPAIIIKEYKTYRYEAVE